MALLEARGVAKIFGPLRALDAVDVSVEANSFHGLIGPNGSGKSTFLKALAGDHYPDEGSIVFDGTDVTRATPAERSRLGMSLKFQITALLPELSVYDNVLLAVQSQDRVWALLRSQSRARLHDEVVPLLERFRLADKRRRLSGELSHGEQQWLEIAMALATSPAFSCSTSPRAA